VKVQLNYLANITSFLALLVAAYSLYISFHQNRIDYSHSVEIQPNVFPLPFVKEGENSIDFEVINTSKDNVQYYISAYTNIGVMSGTESRQMLYPIDYESRVVNIAKSGLKGSDHTHQISLNARAVEWGDLLSYSSKPEYFISVEIFDRGNGDLLYSSECFYEYVPSERAYILYSPVMDTSGKSQELQKNCPISASGIL
jgi:hypothetical protein